MIENNLLRVLVVDDERPIRRFLRTALGDFYTVFEAENGLDALHEVVRHRPDVVLLDLGLPDLDGIEITHRLREWTQVPIIILSIRDEEAEKVLALDAGADDYLTKPFNVGELLARIRVVLRHASQPENNPMYQSGDLFIDLFRREVRVGGEHIALTPTEYEILRLLVIHAGKVIIQQQIIQAVWGKEYPANSHLLSVNMSNLRRKIEKDPAHPRHIVTEPGVGYRLVKIEDKWLSQLLY